MKDFTVVGLRKYLTLFCLVLPLVLIPRSNVLADAQRSMSEADCSRIDNHAERLKCYDDIAGRESDPKESDLEFSDTASGPSDESSYLSRLWDLDTSKRREKYSIMPYRSSYILPISYNNLPNKDPVEEASPGEDVQKTEVKFQISLKVKLWQDILGKDMDLWFGYTQQSFWQLYNTADSSPFRETNYEPEVLVNYRTNFDVLGMKCRIINMGFNHQSNGQSEPLSRSWNRIVWNLGFERDSFTLLLKTWYRIPESSEDDDNPDTDDYFGHGEISGYYFWRDHRLGAMLRNNLQPRDNRGALQLEWCFPLIKSVSGYLQYFTGYGENLLDYNNSVNRIGIGLILTDWI
jgi:phospholipase A1